MNPTVLKEWVNEISEHWFGKPYPDEVVMNARLRTSPRHCKPLPSKANAKKHEYQCESCHMNYKRARRVDVKRYRCGKCKGKLKKIH